jgi:shikimate kinase
MLININNKINISLCGMMGSGKSAIGKILANKLDYNFIDVDKMIESDAKKTIKKSILHHLPQIFFLLFF